jgi:hypothetical protein
MACAQAVAIRGAPTTTRRYVAAPRDLPPLNMAYDECQPRHWRRLNRVVLS